MCDFKAIGKHGWLVTEQEIKWLFTNYTSWYSLVKEDRENKFSIVVGCTYTTVSVYARKESKISSNLD